MNTGNIVPIILSALVAFTAQSGFSAPLPGAIFTTDSTCTGVNLNIYTNKADVYLNGGPAFPGAAGLPDGYYYVQVTEPAGALLGTSVGSGNPTPVHVTNGEFDSCYQLTSILIKASDSTAGYDSTSNPGGVYKVWVSTVATFDNDSTKTDNFKVKEEDGGGGIVGEPDTARLDVLKFYDANANGIRETNEVLITGWKVAISNDVTLIRYTPVSIILEPGTYGVSEFMPLETDWLATTATNVSVTLLGADTNVVQFGNVCLGAGGGHTLGFWSNKNGQQTMNDGGTLAPELSLLSSLNLKNANGSDFNPTTYASFRTWLLNGNAVNMSYMLSVQLSAMMLNVEAGMVSGSALVYAPGCGNTGVGNNFITINDLVVAANTALAVDGYTPDGDANRALQECYKNALDAANNNVNFIQASPCPFTFAP